MKKFFVAALAVLALVGCRDQKQSELDFEAKAGTAKIQGVVTYDCGVEEINGVIVKAEKLLPAGTVVAEISYSEYDAAAKGTRQVEGTIKDGRYEISVPVDMDGVTVKINVRGFYAPYGKLVDGKIVTDSVFYQLPTPAAVTVLAGQEKMAAQLTMKMSASENPARTKKVLMVGTIKGLVEKTEWKDKEDHDKGRIISADAAKLNGIEVVLTIQNTEDSRELIYTTTTNAEGLYSIEANIYDEWNIGDVTVQAKAKDKVAQITHYYDKYDVENADTKYSEQIVNGFYYATTGSVEHMSEIHLALGLKLADVVMPFILNETENVYGVGFPCDYENTSKYTYSYNDPLYFN